MAMEISRGYDHYGMNHAGQKKVEYEKAVDKEMKSVQNPERTRAFDAALMPGDEYISSGNADRKPSGLYRLEQDENCNRKILYDDPRKAEHSRERGRSEGISNESQEPVKKAQVNTDRADREIERLKEEKMRLEQQIRAAADDEEKVTEIRKRLAQIESELSRKNNDTYRMQNSTKSFLC